MNDVLPIRHKKYFWEKFQDRLNEELGILSVGDRKINVISLDEDKKYATFENLEHIRYYEGLKLITHPNHRKGIIGHTAVSPLTYLTHAISWEKMGLTSTDCYKNIIQLMHGSKPNLDRIIFCSDRGYWNLNLVQYIILNGGDVTGTVKRCYWFPCTCDQALKKK